MTGLETGSLFDKTGFPKEIDCVSSGADQWRGDFNQLVLSVVFACWINEFVNKEVARMPCAAYPGDSDNSAG